MQHHPAELFLHGVAWAQHSAFFQMSLPNPTGTFPAGQHPAMSVLGLSLKPSYSPEFKAGVQTVRVQTVHAPITILAKN